MQGQAGHYHPHRLCLHHYYALPPDMSASFGFPSGVLIPSNIPARQEDTLWQEQTYYINPMDALGLGLGGWTLSVHHVYDPQGRVLYYGDGRRRSVDNMNSVIRTFAGGAILLMVSETDCPPPSLDCSAAYAVSSGPDGSVIYGHGLLPPAARWFLTASFTP